MEPLIEVIINRIYKDLLFRKEFYTVKEKPQINLHSFPDPKSLIHVVNNKSGLQATVIIRPNTVSIRITGVAPDKVPPLSRYHKVINNEAEIPVSDPELFRTIQSEIDRMTTI